jgi:glycine dehydrogenase subunit 2
VRLPDRGLSGRAEDFVPERLRRLDPPGLPQVTEPEVVRHYVGLSRLNYGVDSGFYPLGSCSMKYNPKINEEIARAAEFARLHPLAPEGLVQGWLEILYRMEQMLCEVCGLARFTMQPSAGAQGELLGMMLVRAYHRARGEPRTEIIVPDSAHGTNPASAALSGFAVVKAPSDASGCVDLAALRRLLSARTAGLMLTNPNTLGLFEREVLQITAAVHEAGGLVYYDGANFNAIAGRCRPGDMGFDIVHLNLHKTFSTPHGGGGPGAGPVGVTEALAPYLPTPIVECRGNRYFLDYNRPQSIGRLHAFYGHPGVVLRAYCYLRLLGREGLRAVSENAVLNANYLLHRLSEDYVVPYPGPCMHELVISADRQAALGVRAFDIAKRLLDYGIHPPTVYFPLIVSEAIMIEPTETESKETLDAFADLMVGIAREVEQAPQRVTSAPHRTPVSRLDEVAAARQPELRLPATKMAGKPRRT